MGRATIEMIIAILIMFLIALYLFAMGQALWRLMARADNTESRLMMLEFRADWLEDRNVAQWKHNQKVINKFRERGRW